MNNEIEYLQNAATDLDMVIIEKYQEDKRRTVKQYFAVIDGISISPVLGYDGLNNFLCGFRKAIDRSRKALK
jgi:hypothetical protein